jgi:hypothetical protein
MMLVATVTIRATSGTKTRSKAGAQGMGVSRPATADDLVDRLCLQAARDEMQLVGARVFEGELVWRTGEEPAEVLTART